jgi:serine/threonine protein kinase
MELCAEGTLESLVEMSGGLHEGITRRYTRQLLSAAELLHRHGVVHRDIKPANIFLTNDGNHLKLGDFGSAAKIQSSFTVQGELRSYVGTQAYMAPEVFTKNDTEGYGRTVYPIIIFQCLVFFIKKLLLRLTSGQLGAQFWKWPQGRFVLHLFLLPYLILFLYSVLGINMIRITRLCFK